MQENSRRSFLKLSGTSAALIAMGTLPLEAFASGDLVHLTILHTNDVHSRIDPFPMDGGRNQGLGGVARRASVIEKIRSEEPNVLLFDAGDIFQGTPYFNLFGGELEFKLMTRMAYDAATMGNHDFDNGLDGFDKQLPHAQFPFITSNYDFSDTILNGKTIDYKIFKKGGIKIGVFGLGIELEGLVDRKCYLNARYLDPVETANKWTRFLKHDQKCDMVICLSHLGYKYNNNKISDVALAAMTRDIDLIIGGHTHTFLNQPENIKNAGGGITTVNQVGFAGINLGRLDYVFNKAKGKKQRKESSVITIG
jgi:5'-nucleotidase